MTASNNLRNFGIVLDGILDTLSAAKSASVDMSRDELADYALRGHNILIRSLNSRDFVKYQPMIKLLEGLIGDIYSAPMEVAA